MGDLTLVLDADVVKHVELLPIVEVAVEVVGHLPLGATRAAWRGAYTTRMRCLPAVVERCPDTGLFVAHVPGFAGAHTQAASLDELQENLREVIALLLEEGEPTLSYELVGIVEVQVA